MARMKGVEVADPGDDRISFFTSVRIRMETLARIKELAASRNQSRSMVIGDLVERGLEAEEAKA